MAVNVVRLDGFLPRVRTFRRCIWLFNQEPSFSYVRTTGYCHDLSYSVCLLMNSGKADLPFQSSEKLPHKAANVGASGIRPHNPVGADMRQRRLRPQESAPRRLAHASRQRQVAILFAKCKKSVAVLIEDRCAGNESQSTYETTNQHLLEPPIKGPRTYYSAHILVR